MNVDRHVRDTLADIAPAISMDESELLVEILRERELHGDCAPSVVCATWERVRTLVDLRDRAMVVVVDRDIRLTPLGREWAEAFARFTPSVETAS